MADVLWGLTRDKLLFGINEIRWLEMNIDGGHHRVFLCVRTYPAVMQMIGFQGKGGIGQQ